MKYKVESGLSEFNVIEIETESIISGHRTKTEADAHARKLNTSAFEGFTPYFFTMKRLGAFIHG